LVTETIAQMQKKKTQRQRKRENNATTVFRWSPDM